MGRQVTASLAVGGVSAATQGADPRARWRLRRAAASSILALALVTAAAPSGANAADACPNAALRTGRSADLSDCRAYEQVSPAQKLGNSVEAYQLVGPRPGWTSADGSNMLYNVNGPATESAVHGGPFPLVAQRTPGGWANRPAVNGPVPDAPINGVSLTLYYQVATADRTGLAFMSRLPFTSDNTSGLASGDPNSFDVDSFYGVNVARGDRVDWVSRPDQGPAQPDNPTDGGAFPIGGSDDLSTTYFMTRAVLTGRDRAIGRQGQGLYRWRDGVLTSAATLPDGSLDPDGADAAAYVGVDGNTVLSRPLTSLYAHPVTDDGKSLLFVSPSAGIAVSRPRQLYLARDGRPTVLVSKPVDAAAALPGSTGLVATGNGSVAGATSEDGRYVWFTTADQLTPTAPADPTRFNAYRYDVATGTLTYLPEVSDLSASPAPWLFRTSYDGSHALIATAGDLRISRVGQAPVTLSGGFYDPSTSPPDFDSRFSRDGRTLVISSPTPLRGEADHPAGTTQVYRYTESDDHLACLSCGPAGAAGVGSAAITNWTGNGGAGSFTSQDPLTETRALSDDGRTVFFDTTWALLPSDHNDVSDVYEWRDGVLSLISSGAAPEHAGDAGTGLGGSFFVDSSASGDDVFFTSVSGLVSADRDGSYDMYDARVGGGFPEPPVPAAPCSGDVCKAPPGAPPSPPTPGSIAFSGDGNLPAPSMLARRATVSVTPPKAVTGSVASLKVRVSVSGSLSVSGTSVRRATRSASRAATYTVRVSLTAQAKRSLARHTLLKVKVKVSFKPRSGSTTSKTVTISFKPARRTR